jgi:PKHD-type hydroxylase
MKYKKIVTPDFFIGNFGYTDATDEILNSWPERRTQDYGYISKTLDVNHRIRQCEIAWLDVNKSTFIDEGLSKIIHNVNSMIWNFSIEGSWQSAIQFTKYNGKGHHYNWHKDSYDIDDTTSDRVISIVYCLSKRSEYAGGEFQIKKSSNNTIYTKKLDYGDFVVFPSKTLHRVKPLRSGIRMTAVGWYK